MPRRRALAATSAIAAAVIAAVVVTLVLTRGGSTVTVDTTYPASYLIVYHVSQNGAQRWEVLSVQRPFTASDLAYTTTSAPHAGDRASTGNMSTATGLYAVDAQTVRLVSGRQPGPPSGDQYAGEALSELTRRGLAADLGRTATVAGRTCRLYRFAAPPSGAVGPLTSTADGADHDDLCFDSDGLELSESWTYRGAVVLQRTAVDVRSSARALADTSLPTPPSVDSAAPAGPNAATVTPTQQPSTFIATPPAPSGFTPSGPAVDFRFPDPQNPSQTAATSVVWGFSGGPRVITVEAGSERGGGLPWSAADTTESVSLQGLGPASTAVRSDGFEVRVDLGGGGWVRVRGTVPLDTLIAYAHRLTRA
ncbi:MAG TPA: hypothetical protein VN193_13360 [Candidatus Angelobacter sp.]|jgi:hypothetical protein|nr:hypothetical protein [Candidatus Angelobacter sp.]